MKANMRFATGVVILLQTLLTNSLQTVPVPDDLLGPGKCPTGSFCIDTDYCTLEYYTTKSGLPFYCGPHHGIDSMICCVSIREGTPENPKPTPQPSPLPLEDDDDVDENTIETKRAHRSNLNNTLGSSPEELDDDEVDILSVPFLRNDANEDDDAHHHSSNSVGEGKFNDLNDIESLVEEAIEQELNSLRSDNSRLVGDPEKDQQFQRSARLDSDTNNIASSVDETGQEPSDDVQNPEGRSYINPKKYQYQTNSVCACEKGERGEPGPKGDPGEPGQIVYIPVYGNPGPGVPPAFVPYMPMDGSPFVAPPWQYNPFGNINAQQQQRPVRQNGPSFQQQPPVATPYNAITPESVPLSQPGLATMSQTPLPTQYAFNPQAQHKPPPPGPIPQPQPPMNIPVPKPAQPKPPSPLTMPVPVSEDMNDRASRHTSAIKRGRRNRRDLY